MADPTPIELRGYAHPEVLVSTSWLPDHLNDPRIKIFESDEDVLLYDTGHVPRRAEARLDRGPERQAHARLPQP